MAVHDVLHRELGVWHCLTVTGGFSCGARCAALLRVSKALDGLVKMLNAVALVPVLRLTVEQLRGFRDLTGALNNKEEGSVNTTRMRIDGLISSIRRTLAINVISVCVNVPPLFLGALVPAAMPVLRYLYPLSYAVDGAGILTSRALLNRKGARRHRFMQRSRHVSPTSSSRSLWSVGATASSSSAKLEAMHIARPRTAPQRRDDQQQ
jgi:hypothetical protein